MDSRFAVANAARQRIVKKPRGVGGIVLGAVRPQFEQKVHPDGIVLREDTFFFDGSKFIPIPAGTIATLVDDSDIDTPAPASESAGYVSADIPDCTAPVQTPLENATSLNSTVLTPNYFPSTVEQVQSNETTVFVEPEVCLEPEVCIEQEVLVEPEVCIEQEVLVEPEVGTPVSLPELAKPSGVDFMANAALGTNVQHSDTMPVSDLDVQEEEEVMGDGGFAYDNGQYGIITSGMDTDLNMADGLGSPSNASQQKVRTSAKKKPGKLSQKSNDGLMPESEKQLEVKQVSGKGAKAAKSKDNLPGQNKTQKRGKKSVDKLLSDNGSPKNANTNTVVAAEVEKEKLFTSGGKEIKSEETPVKHVSLAAEIAPASDQVTVTKEATESNEKTVQQKEKSKEDLSGQNKAVKRGRKSASKQPTDNVSSKKSPAGCVNAEAEKALTSDGKEKTAERSLEPEEIIAPANSQVERTKAGTEANEETMEQKIKSKAINLSGQNKATTRGRKSASKQLTDADSSKTTDIGCVVNSETEKVSASARKEQPGSELPEQKVPTAVEIVPASDQVVATKEATKTSEETVKQKAKSKDNVLGQNKAAKRGRTSASKQLNDSDSSKKDNAEVEKVKVLASGGKEETVEKPSEPQVPLVSDITLSTDQVEAIEKGIETNQETPDQKAKHITKSEKEVDVQNTTSTETSISVSTAEAATPVSLPSVAAAALSTSGRPQRSTPRRSVFEMLHGSDLKPPVVRKATPTENAAESPKNRLLPRANKVSSDAEDVSAASPKPDASVTRAKNRQRKSSLVSDKPGSDSATSVPCSDAEDQQEVLSVCATDKNGDAAGSADPKSEKQKAGAGLKSDDSEPSRMDVVEAHATPKVMHSTKCGDGRADVKEEEEGSERSSARSKVVKPAVVDESTSKKRTKRHQTDADDSVEAKKKKLDAIAEDDVKKDAVETLDFGLPGLPLQSFTEDHDSEKRVRSPEKRKRKRVAEKTAGGNLSSSEEDAESAEALQQRISELEAKNEQLQHKLDELTTIFAESTETETSDDADYLKTDAMAKLRRWEKKLRQFDCELDERMTRLRVREGRIARHEQLILEKERLLGQKERDLQQKRRQLYQASSGGTAKGSKKPVNLAENKCQPPSEGANVELNWGELDRQKSMLDDEKKKLQEKALELQTREQELVDTDLMSFASGVVAGSETSATAGGLLAASAWSVSTGGSKTSDIEVGKSIEKQRNGKSFLDFDDDDDEDSFAMEQEKKEPYLAFIADTSLLSFSKIGSGVNTGTVKVTSVSGFPSVGSSHLGPSLSGHASVAFDSSDDEPLVPPDVSGRLENDSSDELTANKNSTV